MGIVRPVVHSRCFIGVTMVVEDIFVQRNIGVPEVAHTGYLAVSW